MYIDFSTRNKSFLATYWELKKLGIENNKFFLGLKDKKIKGINPLDKNLDDVTKARIIRECVVNPWYFFREVVRIPDQGSTSGSMFKLHRGNLALIFCLLNCISCILELPRQNYKTMSTIAVFLWLYNFGTEGSNFMFMNKAVKDTKLNIKRMKDLYNLLPKWMDIRTDQDIDNIEFMASEKKQNRVDAIMPANNPDGADKAGRGMTVPLQWFDEFAFTKFNEIIASSSAPAYSRASASAKANGKYYFKLITTTPNNIDIPEGRFCKSLINQAAVFTEFMYEMDKKQLEQYVLDNSSNDWVYIKFTWDKLRRDKAWYIKECRNLNNNLLLISREIDLVWTLSQDNSPFSEEQLRRLRDFKKAPAFESPVMEEYPNFIIKIYDEALAKSFMEEVPPPESVKKCYGISVDVSGGLRQDSTVILFNDPDTLETVAEIVSNTMDTVALEDILRNIADTPQFEYAFFIIERNSYGLGILQHLIQDDDMKRKVFYVEYTEDGKKVRDKDVTSVKDDNRYKREYGINTDNSTRPQMIADISNFIRERPEVFISEILLQQIGTLVVNGKGKVEATRGEHDDAVMSKALFIYAYVECQRIFKRFRNRKTNNLSRSIAMITKFNRMDDYQKERAYKEKMAREAMIHGFENPEHIEHPNTRIGQIISLNSPNFQANDFNPLYKKKILSPDDYLVNK